MILDGAFRKEAPLVLVGAGKMGSALALGWLEQGLDPAALKVVDPQPSEELVEALGEVGVGIAPSVPAGPVASVLVLAVKPQIMDAVLPTLKPIVGPATVTLSIAAGIKLDRIEKALGGAVVRSMPNTPAQVGRGMTVAVGNRRLAQSGRERVTDLLKAVGHVEWVEDEALMDAVTAVSGSGPAYVFLLAEVLAEAGAAAGLPPDLAATLARQTVVGSGMLLQDSELPAGTLRQNVTSPGGTTAAALEVLMAKDGMRPLFLRAVAAATRRSRELAG